MAMPVSLILDTDLDTDCDDVGALAVARALWRRGVIHPQAIICSAPVMPSAPCARLLTEYAGLTDVPIGRYHCPPSARSSRFADYDEHRRRAEELFQPRGGLYNEILVRERYGDAPPDFPDAVLLYREVLARAASGGIVICAIGTLSALEALLHSPPDEISPLSGVDLVRDRVRLLVTMALGVYPEGRDGFNWAMDRVAAAAVLNGWPGEIAVSPAGDDILTGWSFSTRLPPDNPFRRAYEIYGGGPHIGRSSWDQVALLYAAGAHRECFEEIRDRGLTYDESTGRHRWHDPDPDLAPRRYVHPRLSSPEMAAILEDIMVEGALR